MKKALFLIVILSISSYAQIESTSQSPFINLAALFSATYKNFPSYEKNPYLITVGAVALFIGAVKLYDAYWKKYIYKPRVWSKGCGGCKEEKPTPFQCPCGLWYCVSCGNDLKENNRCKCRECNTEMSSLLAYFYNY